MSDNKEVREVENEVSYSELNGELNSELNGGLNSGLKSEVDSGLNSVLNRGLKSEVENMQAENNRKENIQEENNRKENSNQKENNSELLESNEEESKEESKEDDYVDIDIDETKPLINIEIAKTQNNDIMIDNENSKVISDEVKNNDMNVEVVTEVKTENPNIINLSEEEIKLRSDALDPELLKRIVNRLIDSKIISPAIASNPEHLQSVLKQLMGRMDLIPHDLVRDILLFQVEKGKITPDSALLDALVNHDTGLAIVLIKEFNANPLVRDEAQGISTLHWAAFLKSKELFDITLERGGDINAISTAKLQSVAHWAALGGELSILVSLHEKGANFQLLDIGGLMPIHYAAQMGHTLALDYLVVSGCSIDSLDSNKRTPLHWTCYSNQVLASLYLIRNGASQLAKDSELCTPLHWAVLKNGYNVVVNLLESGSDVLLEERDCTNATPSDLALSKSFMNIYDLLESKRNPNILQQMFNYCVTGVKDPNYKEKQQYYFFPSWIGSFMIITLFHLSYWIYPKYTEHSGVVIFAIIITGLSIINFCITVFSDPGYVPLPDVASKVLNNGGKSNQEVILSISNKMPYELTYEECLLTGKDNLVCMTCRVVKQPRSKHCRHCDRCVARFDHHCPWLNNCVAEDNHRGFLALAWLVFIGLVLHFALTANYCTNLITMSVDTFESWLAVLLLCNDIFGLLFAFIMAASHSKQVLDNMTTNEMQNSWRYPYLMDENGRLLNKFDDGALNNCLKFWGLKDEKPLSELKLRFTPITEMEMNRNKIEKKEKEIKDINEFRSKFCLPPYEEKECRSGQCSHDHANAQTVMKQPEHIHSEQCKHAH